MSDIESLRNQKLAEYQEQMKLQEQISQMEMQVKDIMDPRAYERYTTLKTAHQELALQILLILTQAVQSGQIAGMVSDEQFKEILTRLSPKKKDFRITRK